MSIKGFYKCNSCKACKYSKNVHTIEIPHSTRKYTIAKRESCDSTYCIYCLICPCGLWYIGSTIHMAKKRVLEYMRAIKNGDIQYPVVRHFQEKHHSNPDLLSFFVVDSIPISYRGSNREKSLRRLESKYILDFDTMTPMGHNKDEELHVHLGD